MTSSSQFFDPTTQKWSDCPPTEDASYSAKRIAIHERAAALSPETLADDAYPTCVDVVAYDNSEPVYSFHGPFWKIFKDVINMAAHRIHLNNRRKGFWPNNTDETGSLRLALYPETHGRNVGEGLALMSSEHSEGLDAYRTGGLDQKDDKLTHRSGLHTEIVDAMIRGFDWLGGMMEDAGSIFVEKLTYNKNNRGQLHGKRF